MIATEIRMIRNIVAGIDNLRKMRALMNVDDVCSSVQNRFQLNASIATGECCCQDY